MRFGPPLFETIRSVPGPDPLELDAVLVRDSGDGRSRCADILDLYDYPLGRGCAAEDPGNAPGHRGIEPLSSTAGFRMSRRGVIENRRSGERIVLLQTGADTNGELLEFELHLAPGGRVPSGHVHPQQQERFTVLEGRMRFRLGTRAVQVKTGQSVTVRPGMPHSFANAGSAPARLRVEVRPALNMEVLLEAAAALTRERNGMPLGLPRPLDLALFLREFETEVAVPFLPRVMVRLVTRALAWLARLRGLDAHYRRLRTATGDAGEGLLDAIEVRPSQPE